MTKAEIQHHLRGRWKEINAFQNDEARAATPDARIRQFFILLELAREMKWQTSSASEVEEVRARWNKLRKAYGV